METICKQDCCSKCNMYGKECKGCFESSGHPRGGNCVASAKILKDGFDKYIEFK